MAHDERGVLRSILADDDDGEDPWNAFTSARAHHRARLAEVRAEVRAMRLTAERARSAPDEDAPAG